MPDPAPAQFTPPKELKAFPNDRQLCLARFSPCGHFLAAGAMEGTVRRWSVVEKPKAAAEEVLPDEPKKKPAPKNAKKVEESPVDLVPLPHLAGFNGWVQSIAFHPKDKVLYAEIGRAHV